MSILTLDPDLIAALRTDLDHAEYSPDAVEALLGPVAAGAVRREMLVPAHRVLIGRRDPLATLIRLLMMGDSVDHADVAAALPTLGVSGALRLGLVAPEVMRSRRRVRSRRTRPRISSGGSPRTSRRRSLAARCGRITSWASVGPRPRW